MQVYTYSEARQKLALVLDQAENTGEVLIRRKDGRTFALVPEKLLRILDSANGCALRLEKMHFVPRLRGNDTM